jgi:thiamine-monophosphate kinase
VSRVQDIGEVELIRRICEPLACRKDVILGVGDDCAVVSPSSSGDVELVLTSDPVIEGVHFTLDTDPRRVGHKAVGRAFSDLAAMGAEPRWVLINLVAPRTLECTVLDGLYAGARALSEGFGASIIGGDVAEGRDLALHVFAIGSLPKGEALTRGGAQHGNLIFVTGALGGSLGSGRHLDVQPRVREGCWLRGWATAMIDVSDGVASDLGHIVESSGVGCVLETGCIPIDGAARSLHDAISPLDHALHDGEDFELLFTVPAARAAELMAAWQNAFKLPLSCIGKMDNTRDGVWLRQPDGISHQLVDGGFRHFG